MWPHRAHNVPDEPDSGWERRNYTRPKANPTQNPRHFGEMETDRDLDKPVEQLLSDVHEDVGEWRRFAATQPARDARERAPMAAEAFAATGIIIHAVSRMASMQAVVARENQRVQKAIRTLTIGVFVLTVVVAVLTAVLVWLAMCPPVTPVGGFLYQPDEEVATDAQHNPDTAKRQPEGNLAPRNSRKH